MSIRLKIARWLLPSEYDVLHGDEHRRLVAQARSAKIEFKPGIPIYGSINVEREARGLEPFEVLARDEAAERARINAATASAPPEPYNLWDIIAKRTQQTVDIIAGINSESSKG